MPSRSYGKLPPKTVGGKQTQQIIRIDDLVT
jgi:hypothetical protein